VATIKRFEDILAWQKARELSKLVYRLTKHLPFRQDKALQSQMRRAVVSIMANIAEGYERDSGDKDFKHFLSIAKGSAGELRSHLHIALDTGAISPGDFQRATDLACEVGRMLNSFMSYLKPKPPPKI
jgi:four helix bundle protein